MNDINPRVIDNDAGEITVSLDGRELRGWSYSNDDERRTKMLAAREYVEGYCDGRECMSEPTLWTPWHPQYGFQDESMGATWVSHNLDDIVQRVKHLNQDDKTTNRNGWRAVKVTLARATD